MHDWCIHVIYICLYICENYLALDWQDAVKWSTMVMSLTLPQARTPGIVQVGRSNLTLGKSFF